MSHPESGRELPPDLQMKYEADIKVLRAAENEWEGMQGKLEGRIKYGLDPAAMMVVPDVAVHVDRVAQELGTTSEKIKPFIGRLHGEGPWGVVDRLSDSNDGPAQTYLVLAAATGEKSDREGYQPDAYMKDRARVIETLSDFSTDKLEECRRKLRETVKDLRVESVEIGGRTVEVPIAKGDIAIPLAMDGYRGCVAQAGDIFFAQTKEIPDSVLRDIGLVEGYVEVFNSDTGRFDRVSISDAPDGSRVVWVEESDSEKDPGDMKPAAKRIADGYVLTYENHDMAVELVAKSIE